MNDILFCSIPYLELHQIYSAPAVLKGAVQEHGFTAQTIDFGVELFKQCDLDQHQFYKTQNYFISGGAGGLNANQLAILDQFFDGAIAFFKNNPSKYIGISILSNFSHKCALRLLTEIKRNQITSQVVLGGRGVDVCALSTITDDFELTGVERMMSFKDLVKKRNLANFVVSGDGEESIVKILKSEMFDSQIGSTSDYYRQSNPDYQDYQFSYYHFEPGQISLPVTGSKGCVRDCDFCDVPRNFGKYRYRDGKSIAEEMIALQQHYSVNHFVFTDSLVNGGLKPFKEFLITLASFNKDAAVKITWSGQYINRPPQHDDDSYYQLLSDSGAQGLTIGAESGSNQVLNSINKKTTVESLYYDLEQFRKHNITCNILTFVGHWSEQLDDFLKHCEFLVRLVPYVRSGTISMVSLGYPFMLTNPDVVHSGRVVAADKNQDLIWINQDNPTNTFKERVYRRLIVGEIARRLRVPVRSNALVYQYLAATIDQNADSINDFYRDHTSSPSQEIYEKFDSFHAELISKVIGSDQISITLSASEGQTQPQVQIRLNGINIIDQALPEGQHTFDLKYDPHQALNIEISLVNKSDQDTSVDDHGNITKDKFIQLTRLLIQNCDIMSDPDFYHQYAEYQTKSAHAVPLTGLWDNGTIKLEFESPALQDYCNRSNQNVHSTGPMSELSERDYQTELEHLKAQLLRLK